MPRVSYTPSEMSMFSIVTVGNCKKQLQHPCYFKIIICIIFKCKVTYMNVMSCDVPQLKCTFKSNFFSRLTGNDQR